MTDNVADLHVRVGAPDDMDRIMELAMMGTSENGFVRVNPGKLASDIWPALCRDHGVCGVIGPRDGEIQGVVVLRIGSMWYSDDEVVEEKAIFIHPDYRSARGGRAAQLCEFSKRVSDGLGIPLIIGVLSNHRTAGKVRMYKRHFGEPSGAFFLYGARTGDFATAE